MDDPVNRTVTNGNIEVSARVLMGVVMLAHTVVHIFDQDARFPFIFVGSLQPDTCTMLGSGFTRLGSIMELGLL